MSPLSQIDLVSHLDTIGHGTRTNLVGDPKIIELLSKISANREEGEISIGQLILSVVGGIKGFIEDAGRRRTLFLSFSGEQRAFLQGHLGVPNLDKMSLGKDRKAALYKLFGEELVEMPEEVSIYLVEQVRPAKELFEHQQKASLQCEKFLNQRKNVMLHMPTGSGKTRTAMTLAARTLNGCERGVILWIVSGKELCEQAADTFAEIWKHQGSREIPLIRLWGGIKEHDPSMASAQLFADEKWPEDLQDAMIVASAETLWQMVDKWEASQTLKRAEMIRLMIFDEAHRSVADTYKRCVNAFSGNAPMLGLSATPGRSSITTGIGSLTELFDGNRVELEIEGFSCPVEALIFKGFLSRLEKEKLEIPELGWKKEEVAEINKHLASDFNLSRKDLERFGLSASRNLKILQRVEQLVKIEGHKRVIVFAPSVESSNILASLLEMHGIRAKSISAKTAPYERDTWLNHTFKEESDAPCVLVNYGVLTTGFDAPKTSAVVIARPTTSVVLLNQMAGRALRGVEVGGTATAKLVTVVDIEIPELSNTVDQFHAFDAEWTNK